MSRREVLAARSALELQRAERRGVLATRKLTLQIRARVQNAYRSGLWNYSIRAHMQQALYETMRDAMIATHLMGVQRERETLASAMRASGLQLSVFSKLIGTLNKAMKLDMRALQQQYSAQALRVIDNVSDDVEKQLRGTINALIMEGATTKEGIDALRVKFDNIGLSDKKDHKLEAIFRTQTQIAYNAGKWEADQEPEVQEILWGYTYSAVNDTRTRHAHAALDGTTLPKDDPFWERFWPPNGWNCRCVVIPVFERQQVKHPPFEDDTGAIVRPDEGFEYNAGRVFSTARI